MNTDTKRRREIFHKLAGLAIIHWQNRILRDLVGGVGLDIYNLGSHLLGQAVI
jgi:hypothetical protein